MQSSEKVNSSSKNAECGPFSFHRTDRNWCQLVMALSHLACRCKRRKPKVCENRARVPKVRCQIQSESESDGESHCGSESQGESRSGYESSGESQSGYESWGENIPGSESWGESPEGGRNLERKWGKLGQKYGKRTCENDELTNSLSFFKAKKIGNSELILFIHQNCLENNIFTFNLAAKQNISKEFPKNLKATEFG